MNTLSKSQIIEMKRNFKLFLPDNDWPKNVKVTYTLIRGQIETNGKGVECTVSRNYLKSFVGNNKKVADAIKWLVEDDWIKIVKNHSTVSNTSRTYVLTEKARAIKHNYIQVDLYDRKPSAIKVEREFEKQRQESKENRSPIELKVIESLQKLELDLDRYEELDDTENFYKNGEFNKFAYNKFKIDVINIASGVVNTNTSEKVGRLFHNGNLCDKRFRKCFTLNGERLVEIDGVSMHPQIIKSYMTDADEIVKMDNFIQSKNGFYSIFDGLEKGDAKKAFNAWVNGAVRCRKDKEIPSHIKKTHVGIYGLDIVRDVMIREFPVLVKSIDDSRKGKQLGIELQLIESSVFVDAVGEWIIEMNGSFLPIHDAAMVIESQLHQTATFIKETFKMKLGYDVELSVD